MERTLDLYRSYPQIIIILTACSILGPSSGIPAICSWIVEILDRGNYPFISIHALTIVLGLMVFLNRVISSFDPITVSMFVQWFGILSLPVVHPISVVHPETDPFWGLRGAWGY
jgi:hypothetical protein